MARAINAWSLSVDRCSFFHADVHGGNLLLLDDGRVAFIDFGIVGRLPPKACILTTFFSFWIFQLRITSAPRRVSATTTRCCLPLLHIAVVY